MTHATACVADKNFKPTTTDATYAKVTNEALSKMLADESKKQSEILPNAEEAGSTATLPTLWPLSKDKLMELCRQSHFQTNWQQITLTKSIIRTAKHLGANDPPSSSSSNCVCVFSNTLFRISYTAMSRRKRRKRAPNHGAHGASAGTETGKE